MHILLTDVLSCPRCGPDFGLIVLSDSLRDRRVEQGWLGCANCRASYPIREGVADLRYGGAGDLPLLTAPEIDPERPLRVAALLGVRSPNARLLILEESGSLGIGLSQLLPELHVVAGTNEPPVAEEGELGIVSRVQVGKRLPFRGATFSGVALIGVDPGPLLDEIARVLVPGRRLVIEGGAGAPVEALERSGFSLHLEQDGVLVASVSGRR